MRVYFVNSCVIKMLLLPPHINTISSMTWYKFKAHYFSSNTIDAVAFSLGIYYCGIILQ